MEMTFYVVCRNGKFFDGSNYWTEDLPCSKSFIKDLKWAKAKVTRLVNLHNVPREELTIRKVSVKIGEVVEV